MEYAVCHTCRMKHRCARGSVDALEFFSRHRAHSVGFSERNPRLEKLHRLLGVDTFRLIRRNVGEWIIGVDRLGHAGYSDNASVKESFGSPTGFTNTNLNTLANSATAGWQSNKIDNSVNLYDDMIVNLVLGSAVWASPKSVYLYAFGLIDETGTAYTSTGAAAPGASEGTLTFPDVTANPVVAPLLGVMGLSTASVAVNGGPFAIARCFGGVLTPKNGVGIVNQGGVAFASATANYREVYYTVA